MEAASFFAAQRSGAAKKIQRTARKASKKKRSVPEALPLYN